MSRALHPGDTARHEDEPWPVIDLAEVKAFFKALYDALKDATAYANRFIDRYMDDALRRAGQAGAHPVRHYPLNPTGGWVLRLPQRAF